MPVVGSSSSCREYELSTNRDSEELCPRPFASSVQPVSYEREPPYGVDQPGPTLRERHSSAFNPKSLGHSHLSRPKPSKSPAIHTMFGLLHFVTPCYTKIFKKIDSRRSKLSRNPLASAPCNPTFSRHVDRDRLSNYIPGNVETSRSVCAAACWA
jgi:hypothetical protein